MANTNEPVNDHAGAESGLNAGLAADIDDLAPCKKCGGRPTTLIGGSFLSPEYYWGCSECGDKPMAAKTYAGAWDKWQKRNKAANVICKTKKEQL